MYAKIDDKVVQDNNIMNLIELADAEMRAGRYKEAIAFYNSILASDPSYANVWFNKAIAVFKSSTLGNCRFLESKAFFEKAISLSTNPTASRIISDQIIDLANRYYPAYENFFKEHFMAPTSVDSLFNTYLEFDKMIFWATEICPENADAYATGYNLCRQITEMPLKYVNDKRWGAVGAELAGKLTKNYSTEVSGKIDKEIATEVKNKIEKYVKIIKSNALKYEKGIQGIAELKTLIKHYDLVLSKPKISSEGKTFDEWEESEKKSNKYALIAGIVLLCICVYNLYDNRWDITFPSFLWFALGVIFASMPKWNNPTFEKYTKQQGEFSEWLGKSHKYITEENLTIEELSRLKYKCVNIYESYFYFNKGTKFAPETIVNQINELFFKQDAPYRIDYENP